MSRVELIAECASNHGGDLVLAREFIARFAEAGADFIKFQTTRVKHLRTDDPQYAWFQRAELNWDAHAELKATCDAHGVQFLTTVYHADEVPMLATLGLAAIKVGSGEAGEYALRAAVCAQPWRVLASMGLLRGALIPTDEARRIEWLRCETWYPAPAWMCVQRPYMPYLGDLANGLREVGWSDHCVGIEICQQAIWHGARVIEKHVRLPHQAREGRAFEATVEDFKALRTFADADPQRFIGRWQHA